MQTCPESQQMHGAWQFGPAQPRRRWGRKVQWNRIQEECKRREPKMNAQFKKFETLPAFVHEHARKTCPGLLTSLLCFRLLLSRLDACSCASARALAALVPVWRRGLPGPSCGWQCIQKGCSLLPVTLQTAQAANGVRTDAATCPQQQAAKCTSTRTMGDNRPSLFSHGYIVILTGALLLLTAYMFAAPVKRSVWPGESLAENTLDWSWVFKAWQASRRSLCVSPCQTCVCPVLLNLSS